MRRTLLAALIACACLPAGAQARQAVHLRVKLTPERLGHSTSLEVHIDIGTTRGGVPSPLTQLRLHYPSELGLAVSGLGLTSCQEEILQLFGPQHCPASSRMGRGRIRADLKFASEVIPESANLTIVRGIEANGHLTMLFYAEAHYPVEAEIALAGELLAGPTPHQETVQLGVPLVPGVPGGLYAALVQLDATFGPGGLVYYERVHGKLVPYHPRGILLPQRCPAGGFKFSVTVGLLDGTHPTAHTSVPCPPR